ncbi:MAG: NUDIX domain-containing protein [Chloroflexota bacterium]
MTPLLATLFRADGVNIHGRIVHRTAVRAVIQRGENLLMIFSANVGDYKFPGGGVQAEETHEQALRREIREECGAELSHFGEEIGEVVEYNHAKDIGFETFKMTSHYYRCEVTDGFGAQNLDGYEKDLGFRPVWISIEEAIRQNKSLLEADKRPGWLRREIFVLEYLQNK